MPSPSDVPRSISGLCALNAVRLSSTNLEHDAKPLITAIKGAIRHHLDKHLTVAEFEAHELGKRAGEDASNRLSRGIKVSFDHLSKHMMERFLEEAAPAIAAKDRNRLQALMDAFGKEARYRKGELVVGTVEYACKDQAYLGVSTKEPNDPLFIAIEEQVHREFDELFLGMMDTLAVSLTKLTRDAGWSF